MRLDLRGSWHLELPHKGVPPAREGLFNLLDPFKCKLNEMLWKYAERKVHSNRTHLVVPRLLREYGAVQEGRTRNVCIAGYEGPLHATGRFKCTPPIHGDGTHEQTPEKVPVPASC
jgi:hypothetical protein